MATSHGENYNKIIDELTRQSSQIQKHNVQIQKIYQKIHDCETCRAKIEYETALKNEVETEMKRQIPVESDEETDEEKLLEQLTEQEIFRRTIQEIQDQMPAITDSSEEEDAREEDDEFITVDDDQSFKDIWDNIIHKEEDVYDLMGDDLMESMSVEDDSQTFSEQDVDDLDDLMESISVEDDSQTFSEQDDSQYLLMT
jgi:hypothetical protein